MKGMVKVGKIKNWLITGDTHSRFGRFTNLENKFKNGSTAIIILGDAGLNYHQNENDAFLKRSITRKYPQRFYMVYGNHEVRPSSVSGIKKMYDGDVDGMVWYEEDFPNLRYFDLYGTYTINGHPTAIIGGAYSVDKYWRLACGAKWFEEEQMTNAEKAACEHYLTLPSHGQFDFVLSHTCPYAWRPVDKFLTNIDQSTVDNSTELWLQKLKDKINWNVWVFGHYHCDRIERPHVEMMFTDVEELETIWERWNVKPDLDWWLYKGPNYYLEDEKWKA